MTPYSIGIKLPKYRVSTGQFYNTVIPGYQYLFRQLNSLCRDFQIFMIVLAYRIRSTLTAQVSSIEHNSGIVRYRRNDGIAPALTNGALESQIQCPLLEPWEHKLCMTVWKQIWGKQNRMVKLLQEITMVRPYHSKYRSNAETVLFHDFSKLANADGHPQAMIYSWTMKSSSKRNTCAGTEACTVKDETACLLYVECAVHRMRCLCMVWSSYDTALGCLLGSLTLSRRSDRHWCCTTCDYKVRVRLRHIIKGAPFVGSNFHVVQIITIITFSSEACQNRTINNFSWSEDGQESTSERFKMGKQFLKRYVLRFLWKDARLWQDFNAVASSFQIPGASVSVLSLLLHGAPTQKSHLSRFTLFLGI